MNRPSDEPIRSLEQRVSVATLNPLEPTHSFQGWYVGSGQGQPLGGKTSFLTDHARSSPLIRGFPEGGFIGYRFHRYGSVEVESVYMGQPVWEILPGQFRVEWQRFEFRDSAIDDHIDMFSLGLYFLL